MHALCGVAAIVCHFAVVPQTLFRPLIVGLSQCAVVVGVAFAFAVLAVVVVATQHMVAHVYDLH